MAYTGSQHDPAREDRRDGSARSIILQGLFGSRYGWRAEHDWTDVGPRFLEPVPDGKYQGFTIARWLPQLIQEYYQLSGRNELSGRPLRSTLAQLGLAEFVDWAEPD